MQPLPALLTTFEQRFRHDPNQEHALLFDMQGNLIVQRDGDADSVEFSPQELNRACLGLLSHSHPHAKPPSGADLALAAEYGLTLRAFGTAPDTGEQFDHTVKFAGPNPVLANKLLRAFDDAEAQAKRELLDEANAEDWLDLKWERNSRHLAVTRLVARYGFRYQRVVRNKLVAEMSHKQHEKARLDTLLSVSSVMQNELISPLHAQIIKILLHNADASGVIPASRIEAARQAVTALIQRFVLGSPLPNGSLAPYSIQHGQVMPRSLYFRLMWMLMRNAASVAIEYHAAIMRKHLPADLVRSLQMATINPFAEGVHESDDEGDIFPTYDPLHLWVGPDGKRLSDRVWNVAGDMGRKLDNYLTDALSSSKSVPEMAADLEDYLLPNVPHVRINTPYGNMSYEALRLARTETSAAGSRAGYLAARRNPYIETYSPYTAPSHNCSDECDIQEANAPYPISDMSHLPTFHPLCACGVRWNEVERPADVTRTLRQKIDNAIANAKAAFTDFIGPLSDQFLNLLFRGRP